MNYKHKYNKYKNKYLRLLQSGGNYDIDVNKYTLDKELLGIFRKTNIKDLPQKVKNFSRPNLIPQLTLPRSQNHYVNSQTTTPSPRLWKLSFYPDAHRHFG